MEKNLNYNVIDLFMAAQGRPMGSDIRTNMIEILFFLGKATGYEIYKVYVGVFPHVTLRSIYYHLKRGVDLKEFNISEIKKVEGDFSWGGASERIYYELAENARPTGEIRVKKFIDTMKKDKA